jgi:hypothetical protein
LPPLVDEVVLPVLLLLELDVLELVLDEVELDVLELVLVEVLLDVLEDVLELVELVELPPSPVQLGTTKLPS